MKTSDAHLRRAGTTRYVIETDDARILVDRGLFEGYEKFRERNWASVPVEPTSLDAIVPNPE
jgi:metallo-beta-lactamase family protein